MRASRLCFSACHDTAQFSYETGNPGCIAGNNADLYAEISCLSETEGRASGIYERASMVRAVCSAGRGLQNLQCRGGQGVSVKALPPVCGWHGRYDGACLWWKLDWFLSTQGKGWRCLLCKFKQCKAEPCIDKLWRSTRWYRYPGTWAGTCLSRHDDWGSPTAEYRLFDACRRNGFHL